MTHTFVTRLVLLFKGICLLIASSMTIYCIHDYAKNEDTTTVSYKRIDKDKFITYPPFTLCLMDYSLDAELLNNRKSANYGTNDVHQIYMGNTWNAAMQNMDRKKFISRLQKMVMDTCVEGRTPSFNTKKCEHKGTISIYIGHNGWKCFSFQYEEPSSIKLASIWFQSQIMKGVNTFSFPRQLLNINNRWVPNTMRVNTSTDIYLLDLEVYRHRNKAETPCHDWKIYDKLMMEQTFTKVGCRPFYADANNELKNCTKKEEIQQIYELTEEKSRLYPPCIELKKYRADSYTWPSDTDREDSHYPDMGSKVNMTDGWFRITIHFPDVEYKSIDQARSYTLQSLIGNAGGYIGMFIGCTISDLPTFLGHIYRKIINVFV